MIDADRYHHAGRTYVNIFRAQGIILTDFLGLTPQAMNLTPLRGSSPAMAGPGASSIENLDG